jgi:hypothetical protein
VSATLPRTVEDAAREMRAKKNALLQEVFLHGLGEGWKAFYFWLEPWKPGDKTITMHCGPVAPEGVEHEVYDVEEISARIAKELRP